jgi:hypothetical protein
MKFLFFLFLFLPHLNVALNANPKFCVNCVHFMSHERLGDKFGYCNMFPKIDMGNEFLITGEVEFKPVEMHFCSTARNLDHMCGARARRFYPKMDEISIS